MDASAQLDAQRLIERISREHTLDGTIIGTRFESLVSNCLEILSSQLYEKSAHFLLELIQNADDNTYSCPTPSLSFSYKPGNLRIDCNEVGFTAENVEAICAINRSTKSGKTTDGEYIGEKGIGFKSVFKAADVVWISSGEFTFKFDKTKFLGMVTPIWVDFPEVTRPGYTSILLQLSKGFEEETLIHELLTFDPSMLIFLRRIEEINIRLTRQDGQIWERKIRKTESRQGSDRATVLHVGESTFQYLIRTHVIKDIPEELKRPNWSQTKILLAFPTAKFPEQPQLNPQKVYAFLPIRNYGLKFLLQGDFLLTASREDIESTLPWNRAIRDAVAEAFLLSINHFNKGPLKYVWPYYLPSASTAVGSFFEPAITAILTQLKERNVMESCAGTMVKPSSLKYMPLDRFVDGEGVPFTLNPHTAASYLSLKYPSWAIEATRSIGVSQLSPQEFLADLNSAIIQDPTGFQTRSVTWHSQLAETLIKLTTDVECMSNIQDICLIPLNDGTWTSAGGQAIFFSKSETSLEIPSGIEVLIVDSCAENDPNRRKLFTYLGVRAWEATEICRLILEVHESSTFDPKTLAVDQLISHATFLYKASWQPPKTVDLWFATIQDERCRGRKLYIPSSTDRDSLEARIFARLQKQFQVIHGDYRKAFPKDAEWPMWLVISLGLSKVPRLVTPFVEPKPQPTQNLETPGSPMTNGISQPENFSFPTYAGLGITNGMPTELSEQVERRLTPLAELFIRYRRSSWYNFDATEGVDHPKALTDGVIPSTQPATPNLPSETFRRQLRSFIREYSDSNSSRSQSPGETHESPFLDSTPLEASESDNFPILTPARAAREQLRSRLQLHEAKLDKDKQAKTSSQITSKETGENINPSAPVCDAKKNFALSEEFLFMFRECSSSDVLQLLRDNWPHYGQWIDGAHMKWQNTDFLESSNQLRNDMAACLVQSVKGCLPLQDTVLPMIDPQLDEGGLIPALDIKDPKHPEWTLLSYFGVIMKGDVHYYLRCLLAISEVHCPDVDSVAYIYEQIQARYKGNEELIRVAFNERDIILVHSKPQGLTKPTSWTNMKECISSNIAIQSEYPSSSYLFRCLMSPDGDPIALIVATASLITSSTKLEDISRLFQNVSTALKDVNTSKAAQLLKPIQNRPIFPITNGPGEREYDILLDIHNTSWFIADQPLIRQSFHGKLPLLALPIEDISVLEDLFRILRLDNRMLSKRTTRWTQAKGNITTNWAYTASLRTKSPFIKALIPQSHRNKTAIVRQIDEMQASVATDISQTFMLDLNGTEIRGSPVHGLVSLSENRDMFNLMMTEECAAAKCPPYELVALIAEACEIKNSSHYSLLYTSLSSSSIESISSSFTQQGIYIKGLVFDKPKDRYRAQQGDLTRLPSPFWGNLDGMKGSSHDLPMGMRAGNFQTREHIHDQVGDRRLPIMKTIRADEPVSEDIQAHRFVHDNQKFDGWDHIQYLGEHLISKVLKAELGEAYDPERDWTSRLRSRSGHEPFRDSPRCAAFTMKDPNSLAKMTSFVIKYGRSQTHKWKENLRANPSLVFHLDLAVSTGNKTSSFAITTSQVERMRQFRMHDNAKGSNKEIVVLIRVSNVYSKDILSVDLLVDPWRLFDSKSFSFEEDWVLKGTLQENNSGLTRKRRNFLAPYVSWALPPATTAMDQITLNSQIFSRDRVTYTYRALDSGNIRLLYLLPGETVDQLQGVITHVPYKSAGNYRALSYVWGTHQQAQELMTPDGIHRITVSLSRALRALRHKNKAIMLWVDAICINQKDNKEKAQQIRLLPRIFQTAASTYAFLEGGDGSDTAMEMLMQVRAKAACEEKLKLQQQTIDGIHSELSGFSKCETDIGQSVEADDGPSSKDKQFLKDWPENLPRLPASWKHRSIPYLEDAIWASVVALFDLPWFRRVWVIQEIVGAPHVNVVCGKWTIDWNDLHLAMEIIDREVQLSDDVFPHLKSSWEPFLSLAAQREWEARHYRWTLIMLLESFRYAESTLSRDRLFALLGLASDGNEVEFEPDYDNTLESVVLRFARVFVRQGRGMQLLYRAGLSHQSDRFPSWIPDWTVKRPSSLHDSSEGRPTFAASGPQQAKTKCVPDTDELNVEGYEVDFIESISKSSNVESEWGRYFKEIDSMVDSAVLSIVRDPLEDLKWKVPIAGMLYPKVAVSGSLDLKSSYMALRRYIHGKENGRAREENSTSFNDNTRTTSDSMFSEQIDTDSVEKQSGSYIAALQDTLYGWRFVITKQGYVSVVPNMAQIGDVIAIMKGGRVPFIVRKSIARPGAFRLIGECYIHCMMNGEGLSLPGVVEKEFCLH